MCLADFNTATGAVGENCSLPDGMENRSNRIRPEAENTANMVGDLLMEHRISVGLRTGKLQNGITVIATRCSAASVEISSTPPIKRTLKRRAQHDTECLGGHVLRQQHTYASQLTVKAAGTTLWFRKVKSFWEPPRPPPDGPLLTTMVWLPKSISSSEGTT